MNKNSALENREVLKHIRKAVFPNAIAGVLLCVVLILFNLLMIILFINPLFRNIDYLKGRYSQVVLSNELYPECFSEYQFADLVTVYNETKKHINVNVYMIRPDLDNLVVDCVLDKNQIAISEKMAKKLKVGVGSKVYLELSISEEPKEYTIVSVIPYCWNYYDVMGNADFSVAHIGYDSELISRISIRNAYFLNDKEYKDFSNKDYSYINHYDVYGEIVSMRQHCLVLIVTCIVISAILSLIYLLLISKRIKHEAVKYYYNGYKVSFVKKIHLTDYLLTYCIPIFVYGISIALLSLVVHVISACLLSVVIIDIMIFIIVYMKELKAYGKVV